MAKRDSKHSRLWSRLGWSCALVTLSVAAAAAVELQSAPSDIWQEASGKKHYIVFGNAGDDRIEGGRGVDIFSGNASNDKLYAGADGAYLFGGPGDDYLEGSDRGDQMIGGSGADTLVGGAGADLLRGDMREYASPVGGDTPDWKIQYVDGNVSITLDGTTYGPKQLICGVLQAGGVAPTGPVADEGNDLLQGGPGNDDIRGDGGIDTASYSDAHGKVHVSLATGKVIDDGDGGADTLTSIENVTGSAYGDTLIGDDNANQLNGEGGDDTIDGGAGQDTLIGGGGDDRFVFGPGDGNNTILDYAAGDIIDTRAFGFNGEVNERVFNTTKVLTIAGGDVVVNLANYTGPVTVDYQQLSTQ